MLVDNIFEAVQWAHRYCIDYQTNNENITKVFLTEFKENIIDKLDFDQIDHLKEDARRFVKDQERFTTYYPELQVSQTVYDYINLLNEHEGTDEVYSEVSQETLFKFVYWACEYCITRHSYAGAYGGDAVSYLPQFSSEQLRFLRIQLDTRIKELEANNKTHYSNEVVDSSWRHLLCLLNTWHNQEFQEVTAEYNGKEETEICFEDNNGIRRIVSKFFENAYIACYFDPKFIISIKKAEGHRNIKGELDGKEF